MNDVYALQLSAPLIKMVTPEMRLRDAVATHAGKIFEIWNFVGTWPNALEMNQHAVEYGRMFNEVDDQNARNVCVIGVSVRDELLGRPRSWVTNSIRSAKASTSAACPSPSSECLSGMKASAQRKSVSLPNQSPLNLPPPMARRAAAVGAAGAMAVSFRNEKRNHLYSAQHDVG